MSDNLLWIILVIAVAAVFGRAVFEVQETNRVIVKQGYQQCFVHTTGRGILWQKTCQVSARTVENVQPKEQIDYSKNFDIVAKVIRQMDTRLQKVESLMTKPKDETQK